MPKMIIGWGTEGIVPDVMGILQTMTIPQLHVFTLFRVKSSRVSKDKAKLKELQAISDALHARRVQLTEAKTKLNEVTAKANISK